MIRSPLLKGFKKTELIEEKIISSPVSAVTFSNLNGSGDEYYFIEYEMALDYGASEVIFYVEPNGDTNAANYGVTRHYVGYSGSVIHNADLNPVAARIHLGATFNNMATNIKGECLIYAKVESVREFKSECLARIQSSPFYWVKFNYNGGWLNNANITSLVFKGIISGGTAKNFTGTIRLYRGRKR